MGNFLYGRDLKAEWQEQKYVRMDNYLNQRDKVDSVSYTHLTLPTKA